MASFHPAKPPPHNSAFSDRKCSCINLIAVAVGESPAVRCGMGDSPSNGADGIVRAANRPVGTLATSRT